MEEFSKKDVAEITGLSMRPVQYYTERGLVVPEVNLGEGRGSRRLYSKKNLVEIGIIKCLSDYKLSFPVVKSVMDLIRFPVPEDLPEGKKMINRGGLIGSWDKIQGAAYILLYRKKDNGFRVMISLGEAVERILEQSYMEQSESVLIIDFGRIIRMAREA